MSDEMVSLLGVAHRVVVRVEVFDSTGAPVTDSRGERIVLDLNDGNVPVDGSATVRRTFSGELVDEDRRYTPRFLTDALHPGSGNELKVWRGVRLSGGVDELVPCFYGPIRDLEVKDTGPVLLQIGCTDPMMLITDNAWTDPYTYGPGTVVLKDVFEAIVADRLPGTVVNFAANSAAYPLYAQRVLGSEEGGDPAEDLQAIARDLGALAYFDVDRILQVVPVPELRDTAADAFPYSEGPDGAMLLELGRSLSRDPMFNGACVRYGNAGNGSVPGQVTMWDVDPASPTYYLGPFRRKPEFARSTGIPDAGWARIVGRAMLNRSLGKIEAAAFESFVNPAHEPYDPILITRPASQLDGDGFLLDAFTIPLRASVTMQSKVRARQGLIGEV